MSDDPRYHLAAWKGDTGRRARQLAAEPLCRFCLAKGKTVAATVADHIVPHRGDDRLFWDGDLQSLCATCHSRAKQREERAGHSFTLDDDGWPTDERHRANRPQSQAGGGSQSLGRPRSDTGGGLFCAAPQFSSEGVEIERSEPPPAAIYAPEKPSVGSENATKNGTKTMKKPAETAQKPAKRGQKCGIFA